MYNPRNLERICKKIATNIDDELARVGIFFRIFSRVKTNNSFEHKLESKGADYYDGVKKTIQDIIGIRIILYFSDDIPIVHNRLKEFLDFVDEVVDKNEETKFAPTRINLICRIPSNEIKEFSDITQSPIIDTTYEIQLRTILSEGWHEVDHDLRYKCQVDWENNNDLARNFNGILASLETSEFSILSLFEQLSFRHYKEKNLTATFRTKLRIRVENYNISEELNIYLTESIVREIFKLNRTEILQFLFQSNILIPLTFENLIYIINFQFIKNEYINIITPSDIIKELKLK